MPNKHVGIDSNTVRNSERSRRLVSLTRVEIRIFGFAYPAPDPNENHWFFKVKVENFRISDPKSSVVEYLPGLT